MYYNLICILYALLCGQNFTLVKSGCYNLFTELFRELLDLPELHRGMVCGVVHRALRAGAVAIGWLTGVFVTSRTATAPTHRCSYGSGRSGQRLVAARHLLLFLVAVALSLGPSTGRALPLCRPDGWEVPGAAFRGSGALVRQAEERGHILNIVGGELLQHLLIPYPLVKCNYYRSIGDTRNDIANLRELLDEGAQGFPRALLDGMEAGLVTRLSKGALKVGRELVAQL
jgi:hypothetical protein